MLMAECLSFNALAKKFNLLKRKFKKTLAYQKTFAIMCTSSDAEVMELVDVADSKSAAGNSVWVRFPPSAPSNPFSFIKSFINQVLNFTGFPFNFN